jgi:hypothetical protein
MTKYEADDKAQVSKIRLGDSPSGRSHFRLQSTLADSHSTCNDGYENSHSVLSAGLSTTLDSKLADGCGLDSRPQHVVQVDLRASPVMYRTARDHFPYALRPMYTTTNMEYGMHRTSRNSVRAGLSSYVGTLCKEGTLERVFH